MRSARLAAPVEPPAPQAGSQAPLRVLAITKIFPNAAEPLSSPFNRQQFAALGRTCAVEVLATIPWFPGARAFSAWSKAGRLDSVPDEEVIDGLHVRHPRVLYLPRVGLAAAGALYAASLAPMLMVRYHGSVDVVLGSWAYPDGVAAIALARLLGVPAVVKLHGSDIDVLSERPAARMHLRLGLPRAARVVAVSGSLAERAAGLGVSRARIDLVPNGVDRTLFRPLERAAARARLGVPEAGPRIVYVGRLDRDKGVDDLLVAFARIQRERPALSLSLVGDGPLRARCAASGQPGLSVIGPRPLDEVPLWMAAADVVTLPSWHEGSPNVVLEALACGRPVVATRVGGIPEAVREPALGELCAPRDPAALAGALARVLDGSYSPQRIAAAAPGGWDDSAALLHRSLLRAVQGEARAVRP